MTAKEYLLDIGFDDAHLPELFNNDDKSYYQITELMEEYHQSKLKLLGIGGVSQQRELLVDFWMNLPNTNKNKGVAKHYVDKYLKSTNCG